jgi:hypothetical protein
MKFVLRMAVRETRASLRRLFFFFICIAVGVAAIVALRSVIQSVRGVFGTEARSLIAADVLIATNRDWTRGRARDHRPRLAEAGGQRAHRARRDADDGEAGGSIEAGGQDGGAAGGAAAISAVRQRRSAGHPDLFVLRCWPTTACSSVPSC